MKEEAQVGDLFAGREPMSRTIFLAIQAEKSELFLSPERGRERGGARMVVMISHIMISLDVFWHGRCLVSCAQTSRINPYICRLTDFSP